VAKGAAVREALTGLDDHRLPARCRPLAVGIEQHPARPNPSPQLLGSDTMRTPTTLAAAMLLTLPPGARAGRCQDTGLSLVGFLCTRSK
jgi:hypothetical protein